MKVVKEIGGRLLRFVDLPKESPLRELTVTLGYTREENDGQVLDKALTLDGFVIPALIAALNKEEAQ